MTTTQDPFDALHDQLVVAAGGAPRSGRRGGLPLIVAALALCLAGAAVAAITLTRDDPKPGARATPTPTPTPRTPTPTPGTPRPNRTPPGTAPRPPRGGGVQPPPTSPPGAVPTPPNYQVELMPDLTAGIAGWCIGVTTAGSGVRAGGRHCELAGPPGSHLIASGGRLGLMYVVVDRSVTALDLSDGRRIVPQRDPALPPAWRLATYDVQVRGGTRPPTFTLRDSGGRALTARATGFGRGALPTRRVNAKRPPRKPCAIRVRAGSRVRAVSARLLTHFETLDVVRPGYLSCSTTVVSYRGRRYQAGVLLNARDLQAPAPPLPDAPNSISVKRAGPGWLAVFGGTTADRKRVLRALRATRP